MSAELYQYLHFQQEIGTEDILFDLPAKEVLALVQKKPSTAEIQWATPKPSVQTPSPALPQKIPSKNNAPLKKGLLDSFQDMVSQKKPIQEKPKASPLPKTENTNGQLEEKLQAVKDLEAFNLIVKESSLYQNGDLIKSTGASFSPLAILTLLPTPEDDKAGKILQGAEGELLNNMLKAIEIERESIFCTSIFKQSATMASASWKERKIALNLTVKELELVGVKHVILLGEKCAQFFLKSGQSLEAMRQTLFTLNFESLKGVTSTVHHHPYELIVKQEKKHLAWEDLKWFQKSLKSKILP